MLVNQLILHFYWIAIELDNYTLETYALCQTEKPYPRI